MKRTKHFIIAAFSAAWLIPLYLAFDAFRSFLVTELEPLIKGEPLTHSFGMLYLCGIWLTVTAWWLAVVIFCWSIFFLRQRERV